MIKIQPIFQKKCNYLKNINSYLKMFDIKKRYLKLKYNILNILKYLLLHLKNLYFCI